MKQVIIIRKDLKMRRGKEIAQGAHASLGAFITQLYGNTGRFTNILGYADFLSENGKKWLDAGMKKITVQVSSEKDLLDLCVMARKLDLPTYLVKDAGLTEFKEPTYTTLAIGPAKDEDVDKITKNLKLY